MRGQLGRPNSERLQASARLKRRIGSPIFPPPLAFCSCTDRGSSPQKEKNRSRFRQARALRTGTQPITGGTATERSSSQCNQSCPRRLTDVSPVRSIPSLTTPSGQFAHSTAKASPVARSPSGNIRSLRRRSDLRSCTAC
jgi:hypothetical protein